MKKLLVILLALLLCACTTKTEHGPCVGANDDHDPKLVYKVNTWNVIWGVVFIETIVVPVIVVLDDFSCPIGVKP